MAFISSFIPSVHSIVQAKRTGYLQQIKHEACTWEKEGNVHGAYAAVANVTVNGAAWESLGQKQASDRFAFCTPEPVPFSRQYSQD